MLKFHTLPGSVFTTSGLLVLIGMSTFLMRLKKLVVAVYRFHSFHCFVWFLCIVCMFQVAYIPLRNMYIPVFLNCWLAKIILESMLVRKELTLTVLRCFTRSHWPFWIMFKADSRFAPSQWQTALLSKDVSHWLGANLESALMLSGYQKAEQNYW